MGELDIDEVRPVAVRDLPGLLGVSRSRVFAALAALRIERVASDTGAASVSGESVDLLRRAFAFTRGGGSLADFRAQHGLAPLPVTETPPGSDDRLTAILGAVLALLERQTTEAIAAKPEADASVLLDRARRRAETLDAVIRAGTTLTTSEAAAVLGLAERSLLRRSTPFEAFGMVWSRRKVGKFVEWSVRPVAGPSRDGLD